MCLICMKCGRCPGILRNADAAGAGGRELVCLKCGAPLADGDSTCPECGALALVPPGVSMRDASMGEGQRRTAD